jgi:signal transduction histidine kinase/ligand-binding sensor domain-containing protein
MAAIVLLPIPAIALNQAASVHQYGHRAWTLRESALPGYPRAVTQGPDGYLWLATEFGLLRFDGVQFVPWRPSGSSFSLRNIVALLATRDGGLWIGTDKGLARWKRGVLTEYPELKGQYVGVLVQTEDDTVWAATNGGKELARLCAFGVGPVTCHGSDGRLGRFVLSLQADRKGGLWVGAAAGLWHWTPQTPTLFRTPRPSPEIHAVVEDGQSLLVALEREILRLENGKFARVLLEGRRELKPTTMLRDRDGGLWVGTQDQGIIHVRRGAVDVFARANGLSHDFVISLFEDREGNIWVATLNGLDRFRDVAVTRISTQQGLSNDTVTAVQASQDGDVWLGTVNGLNRWKDGRISRLPLPTSSSNIGSLFEDSRGRLWVSSINGVWQVAPETGHTERLRGPPTRYVRAMTEGERQTLWISDAGQGLLRVRDGAVVDRIPWSEIGGASARVLAADADDGVWLGFDEGGIAYVKNNRVQRRVGEADGLGDGNVNGFHVGRGGVLWVATRGGLTRLTGEGIHTLRTRHGLPCDSVQWVIEDDAAALWLHTPCGIVQIGPDAVQAWVDRPDRAVQVTVYDLSDGVLRFSDLGNYGPKVTKARDGRLWFASYDGAGVIDPKQLPSNPLAPPVHIEQAICDRITYDVSSHVRLPALARDLRIDYAALSFVAPERVRFRHKLDGHDEDWVDAGNRRQALYNDLPPGTYRFRVTAANDHGVWNEEGKTWEFSIAPAPYQTTAFRGVAVLLVVATLSFVYRVRARRLAAEFSIRFEERLGERTRIAQELHDTLLQGCISSSMQLHVLRDEIADQNVRTKLSQIVQQLAESIDESRRSVQGMRIDTPESLERVLVREAESFRGEQEVNIHVAVKGKVQPLQPLTRDTVCRIGREALANAFRHARAKRVEIEIVYSAEGLSLYIRDDGCGIVPTTLASGKSGHWGLPGMRERASQIRGTLRLLSRIDEGTEVELKVPSHAVFVAPAHTWTWLSRLAGRRADIS